MKKYICLIISIFILLLLTSCSIASSNAQDTHIKTGEMKIAVFSRYSYFDLQKEVNTWLSNNSETEIIDIQFSTSNNGGSCMVWYYDVNKIID